MPAKTFRTLAAVALSASLALGAAACSKPQSLIPYTPAEGVQTDVQVPGTNGVPLKVRNAMILTQSEGSGTLVGAIQSPKADTLKMVQAQAIGIDGKPAGLLKAGSGAVTLEPEKLVQLLDQPAITLSGEGLVPGRIAEVVLVFEKAGPVSLRMPIVDGSKADYKTATPKPAAGGEATPAATPTPGA